MDFNEFHWISIEFHEIYMILINFIIFLAGGGTPTPFFFRAGGVPPWNFFGWPSRAADFLDPWNENLEKTSLP